MPYMSHSQLELLKPGGCPQLHWFKYNPEGKAVAAAAGDLVGPRPVHISYGIAVHAGVEAWGKARIDGDEEPALEILWDAFEARFLAEIEANPDMDLTGPDGKEQSPAKLVLDGKAQLRQFYTQVAPQVAVVLGVETKVAARIPGQPGWDMIGYIDMLGYDHQGRLRVWDLKTAMSAKEYTQEKADHANQVVSYLWQLRESGQPVPEVFTFVVLVRGLYGRPHKVLQVTTTRTPEQLDAYAVQVTYAVQLRKAGFHAPNPNYQWHSRCPFLAICPHGDPAPATPDVPTEEEMEL